MNLELSQWVSKSSGDSSRNSISETNQPGNSLSEFDDKEPFLQQLQQEFRSFEVENSKQKLPANGNNLPVVTDINQDESDLFLSDELNDSNIIPATLLPLPVQPVVLSPQDIKAGQQTVALNKPVNVLVENSEVITDEAYTDFSDEEMTEVTSELIQPELNRKNQMSVDVQLNDIKSGRGDATLVTSSIAGHLSLSPKSTESASNLNAFVESPVSDHEGWGDELSNRMVWMVRQDIKVANLRLNPSDLGPVEIRIQIKNEQVDIHFNSTHAQVREAIEVAVPKLREMFNDQLLRLDNVNISQNSFEGQKERSKDHDGENFSESDRRSGEIEPEDESISVLSDSAFMARGRIDYFV